MKKALLFLTLIIFFNSYSQVKKHPDDDGRTIRIPIVFHVLNKKANNYFTDERIKEELNSLNLNYNAENDLSELDVNNQSNLGNMNIQFYLLDNDQVSNGIKRYKNSLFRKRYSRSVNRGNCLNVFIGNFGTKSDMLNKSNTISLQIKYSLRNFSSSLSHEVGHWLGLWHVFGPGNCGYKTNTFLSDSIPDTKPQKKCTDLSYDKEKCKIINKNKFPNYQNFMDYSGCRIFFTKDQSQTVRNKIIKFKREVFDLSN